MKIKYYILSFFTTILVLSSCISSQETSYMQDIPKGYAKVKFDEYIIAPRDVINCVILTADKDERKSFAGVISEAQNSGLSLTVYEDSTIIIPFFGSIKLAGLTLQEAEQEVEDLMKESIMDAQVTLNLVNNYFYIYSKEKAGMSNYLVYKENMTIYQALAISGQTTQKMDLEKVTIVRKGADGKDMKMTFDLRSSDIIQSEFYYIKPNDVIYFPTSKNAFFNVSSVKSFMSTVMTPLTFLFFVTNYNLIQ